MTDNSIVLKLASLNMEKYRHVNRAFAALLDGDYDVLCLQEVPADLCSTLEHVFGVGSLVSYEPMARSPRIWADGTVLAGAVDDEIVFGLATLVRTGNVLSHQCRYYHRESKGVPLLGKPPYASNRFLQHVAVKKDGILFNVVQTHFTWTPDGQPSIAQREDMDCMFEELSAFPDIIFCGDFNAPRGGSMWGRLAARYRDNIPECVDSTLDNEFHRAAPLLRVVDGMFTTPHYEAQVEVIRGVSDHKLVAARIARVL